MGCFSTNLRQYSASCHAGGFQRGTFLKKKLASPPGALSCPSRVSVLRACLGCLFLAIKNSRSCQVYVLSHNSNVIGIKCEIVKYRHSYKTTSASFSSSSGISVADGYLFMPIARNGILFHVLIGASL